MGKNNARLPNIEPYIAAGINPKTKLPYKFENSCDRKRAIKTQLRILDEQNAVNRYTWYNLPCDLSSQELERLLYYKGQLSFFFFPAVKEWYFMPYALDGTIDFYGRYNQVHPVPMADGGTEKEKALIGKQRELLSTLKLKVLYDIPNKEIDFMDGYCVLLHDYTKQLSQTTIPRQQIQDDLLDIMSDCIPFMRTALLNSTGVNGMRVENENDYPIVQTASDAVNDAALKGQKWVPVASIIELQELTGGNSLKSEEFMLAMQSLDNYRLSLYGLDNGGLFQKKSHMLEAEQEMNQGNVGLVLQDGLSIRQRFCDIVNAVTGLGISCEIAESVINADMNGDGLIMDEMDQTGTAPGEQDHTQGGE